MSLGTSTIIFDALAADPGSPEAGEVWFNTTDGVFRYYDGASTLEFETEGDLNAHIADTGNPHQVTLEQARTQGAALAGAIDMGGNLINNVGTAVATTDAVNLQQVRDEIKQRIDGNDWQESVLDQDLLTPPGAPALGDRYLVNGVGLGAWAGQDNNIAEWDGAAWDFITPDEGTIVPVEDESNELYRFTGGSWSIIPISNDHGSLLGLGDDDHVQYLLVGGSRAMSGNLDMGGNEITNVGNVDGVDVSAHAARHITGGADEIDGDQLDIDFTPTNYTPSIAAAEATNVDHLAAHLQGIDDQLLDTGIEKRGRAVNADFTGTPLTATITFNTAMPSTSYGITLGVTSTGRDFPARVLNKTVSGFDIRLGSNNKAALVEVAWVAAEDYNP